MESLLKGETELDEKLTPLEKIKHPKLKRLLQTQEKLLLVFVSSFKRNISQLRKLSQMCRKEFYHLEVIHMDSEEEFEEMNELLNLSLDSIADPELYLFNKFKIDFKYNLNILKNSTGKTIVFSQR
jgi:hypothetical protein